MSSDTDRDTRPVDRGILLAEEERRRVAEGLHDGPIQWLASASLQVATMLRRGEPDMERLESIEDILARAIGSLRRMMFSLYPPDVDGSNVEAAVTSLARWILADADIEPQIDIDMEEPIVERPLRSVVFGLVQEAVTNAKTHAQADEIQISLVERNGIIRIRVSDDGVGFDPETDKGQPGHLGLRIMRERAEGVGGTFEVTTTIGSGTTVAADIPRQTEGRDDSSSVDGQDRLGEI